MVSNKNKYKMQSIYGKLKKDNHGLFMFIILHLLITRKPVECIRIDRSSSFIYKVNELLNEKGMVLGPTVESKIMFFGGNNYVENEVAEVSFHTSAFDKSMLMFIISKGEFSETVTFAQNRHTLTLRMENASWKILEHTRFSHKNIFSIFDIIELDGHYIFLQEDIRKFRYVSIESDIGDLTAFQIIKIISTQLYSLKYLHSMESLSIINQKPFVHVDEVFNVKNGVMFDVILEKECTFKIEQKLNWPLYKTYNYPICYIEKVKEVAVKNVFKKTRELFLSLLSGKNKNVVFWGKEDFIQLLDEFEFSVPYYIDNLIESEFLDPVVIYFIDFRNLKSASGSFAGYRYLIEQNRITFKSLDEEETIEITIIGNVCYKQFYSGRMDHYSFGIKINDKLVEPDNLREDEFTDLKNKLDIMSIQLEIYSVETPIFELQNEFFIFLEYQNPKRYYLTYLKHQIKGACSVIFEFFNDKITVKYLPSYINEKEKQEYLKQAKSFIKYIIQEKDNIIKDLKKYSEPLLFNNEEDDCNRSYSVELSEVYVPGVGKKKKNEKIFFLENYYTYSLRDFKILSKKDLSFFKKGYGSKHYTKINDIDEYIQDISWLLDTSYVFIKLYE